MKEQTMLPVRAVVVAIAAFVSFSAHAIDAFDPVTNRLTMESISVGGQNYRSVAVTLGSFSVLSVGSGAAVPDTFDPATNILTLGAVAYQGATYNNVQVRVNSYSILNFDPGSSYTGEQAVAYNLINAERNTCGFGLLAQNASLDAAADAHAHYTFQSGQDAHTEIVGQPGFTGVRAVDRMNVKGYAGTVSTVGEAIGGGPGSDAIRGLLSAPYHLNGLMRGYRGVGLGYLPAQLVNALWVIDVGYLPAEGPQLLGSNDVNTYPCNGSVGVNWRLRGEAPNPVPGRDLSTNPIGAPILIKVREGNVLQITGASMINAATGAAVVLRAPVGSSNDPNKVNGVSYFGTNEAYVAPDAALQPGTAYQVTIAGTNNGAAFSRTFSFTTGTGVN